MVLAATWAASGTLVALRAPEWFIAFSMCILVILKLRNLETFSNMFVGYDLLARRYVRYAYVYPFGEVISEVISGVLMIAGGPLKWIAIPIAFVIGSIGAVSVFKAVYVDRRELKCACVGGRQQGPSRLHFADRESHDGGHGSVDDDFAIAKDGHQRPSRPLVTDSSLFTSSRRSACPA